MPSQIKKLICSFGYAFKGIGNAATTQLNFRVHLVAALVAISLGIGLHISSNEWMWIMLCITLVLVAEMFNTAIEFLTDLVSPGYHPKAGHVKDIAAGAVLLCAIFALIMGIIIFEPKIAILMHHAAQNQGHSF